MPSEHVFTGQHAKCSQCGHEGDVYVDIDGTLAERLNQLAKELVEDSDNTIIRNLEEQLAAATRRASRLPGLTATLDEYAALAALVRECLAEHDAAGALFASGVRPDAPITARVREALAGLPDVGAAVAALRAASGSGS